MKHHELPQNTIDFKQQLQNAKVLYLQPGELAVGRHGEWIYSVLGSCVSVCLYSPGQPVGAMNHFMLARPAQPGEVRAKYGPEAMQLLLDKLQSLGVQPNAMKAKVFGGSNMRLAEESPHSVGNSNAQLAKDWLRERGIQIQRMDIGGHQGRKIYFDTQSHTVWLKNIRQINTQ